jgi:hypothetical protein
VTPAYAESFAHPLVEAMSSGLPVVASDLPVHQEICGDAGVYFERFSPQDLAQRILAVAGSGPCRCIQLEAARRSDPVPGHRAQTRESKLDAASGNCLRSEASPPFPTSVLSCNESLAEERRPPNHRNRISKRGARVRAITWIQEPPGSNALSAQLLLQPIRQQRALAMCPRWMAGVPLPLRGSCSTTQPWKFSETPASTRF